MRTGFVHTVHFLAICTRGMLRGAVLPLDGASSESFDSSIRTVTPLSMIIVHLPLRIVIYVCYLLAKISM